MENMIFSWLRNQLLSSFQILQKKKVYIHGVMLLFVSVLTVFFVKKFFLKKTVLKQEAVEPPAPVYFSVNDFRFSYKDLMGNFSSPQDIQLFSGGDCIGRV
ncbi:hypothetical protein KBI33_02565 [Candidatus Shapirobacteria bacterium]|nr:hypothetical protein [Candidatus Shapirobacteria bacterium]